MKNLADEVHRRNSISLVTADDIREVDRLTLAAELTNLAKRIA